jgi:hypothetical protein
MFCFISRIEDAQSRALLTHIHHISVASFEASPRRHTFTRAMRPAVAHVVPRVHIRFQITSDVSTRPERRRRRIHQTLPQSAFARKRPGRADARGRLLLDEVDGTRERSVGIALRVASSVGISSHDSHHRVRVQGTSMSQSRVLDVSTMSAVAPRARLLLLLLFDRGRGFRRGDERE